jgi:ATP-dependent exoDNAse (exonuclease V) alpha subunit
MVWNQALREVLGRGKSAKALNEQASLLDRGLLEPGEPVVVYQNSQAYGVMNGDVFVVSKIEEGPRIGPLETMWLTSVDARRLLTHWDGRDWPLDGERPWIGKGKYAHWTYRDYMQELIQLIDMKAIPEAPVPVSYAYVLTAHKAQGSEYRRATVFLERDDYQSPNWRKPTRVPGHAGEVCQSVRWLYTATTRGKQKVTATVRREPPPLLRRLAGR